MSEVQDKNALLVETARHILADARYQTDDWDAIALVFNFEGGRKNIYGYVYFANGDWEARAPRDNARSALEAMIELQSAMENETGKKWQKALIQITRSDQGLNIVLEYDDPKRWSVSPSNLESLVAELKP